MTPPPDAPSSRLPTHPPPHAPRPSGATWSDHLEREGLGQFTETMADLLPDATKGF